MATAKKPRRTTPASRRKATGPASAKQQPAKKQPAKKQRKAPAKRRTSRRRLYKLSAVVVGLLLAPVATVLVWGALPGPGTGRQVELDWPAAPQSASEAARRLADAGLLTSPRLFAAYFTLVRPSLELSPGPHLLDDRLTPKGLVQRLARLAARPRTHVTIPEGYNYLQIAQRLQQLGICSAGAFQRTATDRALLAELRIPGRSAEGYLFPARYGFPLDSDPAVVLRRLVHTTRNRLRKLDQLHEGALKRLENQRGWTEYQVLTLASIIEKETGKSSERRIVASVYFNRLDDPDFRPLYTLQADPTAGYGCLVEPAAATSCAGYSGHITPAMLRDPDNPYNTYRHAGLPPGPIANPGTGALAAVIEPAHTDYLFFVAHGGGGHTFSRTFDEQNAAIQRGRRDAGP